MEDQIDLPELIKKFRALKTHGEKCEFLHDAKHYPHLARIYSPVHFPKPAAKPEQE